MSRSNQQTPSQLIQPRGLFAAVVPSFVDDSQRVG